MALNNHTVYISGPGSGKSFLLVENAINSEGKRILMTTFTRSNAQGLRDIFEEKKVPIPSSIKIVTWWSFLLNQAVKPFQGVLTTEEITGMKKVETISAIKYYNEDKKPVTWDESDTNKHFFNEKHEIYSDKIAKFAIKCDDMTNGAVIRRIANLFDAIYIDEVQDLVGYDLELIKRFFKHCKETKLVGDPRQVTYQTHHNQKFKKYNQGKLLDFISNECNGGPDILIDEKTLGLSRRLNEELCIFANKLRPDFPEIHSKDNNCCGHDGVFYIEKNEVPQYLEKYRPVQLRLNKNQAIDQNYRAYNFGECKGCTFDHVLIYPTMDMYKWTTQHKVSLKPKTLAQFYVAITRARYSAAFVIPTKDSSPGQLGLPF